MQPDPAPTEDFARPDLDLYANTDGFVVAYHGHEIAAFQTWDAASVGMRLARETLAALAFTLSNKPREGEPA